MTQCWAAVLGSCDTKTSREHLVSAALWKGPRVLVVGLPWCKDQPKTVGVSAITSKILCRKHNSGLSETDSAAGRAFDALEAAALLSARRKKLRPRKWKVSRYEINGQGLERWFLKTLINVVVHKETDGVWARTGAPLAEPPEDLVKIAFGQLRVDSPVGLYGVASIGEDVIPVSGVEVRTMLTPPNTLVGAVFTFFGFRFFLYVDDQPLPKSANLPSSAGWIPSGLLYHLKRINSKVEKKLSHYVHLLWDS